MGFPLITRESFRLRANTRGAICDLRPQSSPQDSHCDHTLATGGATPPARLFHLYFLRDSGFGCRNACAVCGVAEAPFRRRSRRKGYCPPPELTAKSLIGLGARACPVRQFGGEAFVCVAVP